MEVTALTARYNIYGTLTFHNLEGHCYFLLYFAEKIKAKTFTENLENFKAKCSEKAHVLV
jgi:hypothetical protein